MNDPSPSDAKRQHLQHVQAQLDAARAALTADESPQARVEALAGAHMLPKAGPIREHDLPPGYEEQPAFDDATDELDGFAEGPGDDASDDAVPSTGANGSTPSNAPRTTQRFRRYVQDATGFSYVRPAGGGRQVEQLTNFTARITRQTLEDDGVDVRSHFEIEALVRGRTQRVVVEADEFHSLGWVVPKLGPHAIVYPDVPHARDHTKAAIQTFSSDALKEHVFVHVGWRRLDGELKYLHAGGALGPGGLDTTVRVTLSDALGRTRLPSAPTDPAVLRNAVRTSLALLDLGPYSVTVPLVAATYLAPLVEFFGGERPDFVPWFYGESQQFKSELVALLVAHFGAYTRQTLPASFESTANALEAILFAAKDMLLPVDDFRRTDDRRKAQTMAEAAERLLRAVGNNAARQRMNTDQSLRPELRPRGLPVVTAELLPPGGYSTRARAFLIALPKDSINVARLTSAQASRDQLVLAMAGFLDWVARIETDGGSLSLVAQFRVLRSQLVSSSGYRREPSQVAYLFLGFWAFVNYACAVGVLSPEDARDLLDAGLTALHTAGKDHAAQLAETRPVDRFLSVLRDGFALRKIYVEDKSVGGAPDVSANPEFWGWEADDASGGYRHAPGALMAGWLDGEHVLLLPESIKAFIADRSRAVEESFPCDWTTLLKHLDEEGTIDVRQPTPDAPRERAIPVYAAGSTRRVVKLRRSALEGDDDATE